MFQIWALIDRARVAIAQGEPNQADQDAHTALAVAETTGGYLHVPDAFECLATLDVSSRPLNKEIAARLFISPRTAQPHLTHIYSKLNLTPRVQVVQEAARHIGRTRPGWPGSCTSQ